jgi:hypothetical protein
MARIIAPNKEYAGVSAGVPFSGGEGHTDDEYLINWFRDHGYEVIKEPVADSETEPKADPETAMETEGTVAPAQRKGRKKET